MSKAWAARLLETLDNRGDDKELNIVDLGTIKDDGSLLLDQFSAPIPREGYLVAEWDMDMRLPTSSRVIRTASNITSNGDSTADTSYSNPMRLDFLAGDDPEHVTDVGFQFGPALYPGDRVLAIWVSGEIIIISKVVSGDDA